jgi:hypothetical protein
MYPEKKLYILTPMLKYITVIRMLSLESDPPRVRTLTIITNIYTELPVFIVFMLVFRLPLIMTLLELGQNVRVQCGKEIETCYLPS